MPWLHRRVGNPVLSWLGRRLFHTSVSDFHCGLRALTRRAYEQMGLRTTGMEFASELVVKAAVRRMRIDEVPITLRPDGRSRPPHLRRWRDGWRHLRFLLTLSPRWTLGLPGLVLAGLGAALMSFVAIGPAPAAQRHARRPHHDRREPDGAGGIRRVHHRDRDADLRVAGGARRAVAAPRTVVLALHARARAAGGSRAAGVGAALLGHLVWEWWRVDFGPLDVTRTLRPTILGATLVAVGVQTVLASFVYSMLGIRRRRTPR